MSNTVIKVENRSKQYRLGTVGTGALSHDINLAWHHTRGKEDPYLKIGEAKMAVVNIAVVCNAAEPRLTLNTQRVFSENSLNLTNPFYGEHTCSIYQRHFQTLPKSQG